MPDDDFAQWRAAQANTSSIASQKAAIDQGANSLGIDPIDYATAMSYESAGSFDPWKKGPVTKWGQHRGTIQYGEPQQRQYGVTPDQTFEDQVTGSNVRYLKDHGVRPGMTLPQVYAAINGGSVNADPNTLDANTGRTIADNIRLATRDHRAKVIKRFGYDQTDDFAGSQGQQGAPDDFAAWRDSEQQPQAPVAGTTPPVAAPATLAPSPTNPYGSPIATPETVPDQPAPAQPTQPTAPQIATPAPAATAPVTTPAVVPGQAPIAAQQRVTPAPAAQQPPQESQEHDLPEEDLPLTPEQQQQIKANYDKMTPAQKAQIQASQPTQFPRTLVPTSPADEAIIQKIRDQIAARTQTEGSEFGGGTAPSIEEQRQMARDALAASSRQGVSDNSILGIGPTDPRLTPEQNLRNNARKILNEYAPVSDSQIDKWINDSKQAGIPVTVGDPNSPTMSVHARMLAQIIGPDNARKIIEDRLRTETAQKRGDIEAQQAPGISLNLPKQDAEELNQKLGNLGSTIGSYIAGASGNASPEAGDEIGRNIGESVAGFFGEANNEFTGGTAKALAGLGRALQYWSPTSGASMQQAAGLKPYEPPIIQQLQDVANGTQEYATHTGNDGVLSWAFKTGGALAGSTPRLMFMSALPGGIVTALPLDATAQAYGGGATGKQALVAGAKQIPTALAFGVAPWLSEAGRGNWGTKLLADGTVTKTLGRNIAEQGEVLGTIGLTSYISNRVYGESPADSLKSALMNMGYHTFGKLQEVTGKAGGFVIRARNTEGDSVTARVGSDGKVTTVDPKTKVDVEGFVPDGPAVHQAIANAPNQAERRATTTVPGTAAEPEQQYGSQLDEIRAKGAGTVAKIQELFPQLSDNEAADLHRQAWGDQTPTGTPAGPPVEEPTPRAGETVQQYIKRRIAETKAAGTPGKVADFRAEFEANPPGAAPEPVTPQTAAGATPNPAHVAQTASDLDRGFFGTPGETLSQIRPGVEKKIAELNARLEALSTETDEKGKKIAPEENRDEYRQIVQAIKALGKKAPRTPEQIAASYHDALSKGDNPELVKAVDDILGKQKTVAEEKGTDFQGRPVKATTTEAADGTRTTTYTHTHGGIEIPGRAMPWEHFQTEFKPTAESVAAIGSPDHVIVHQLQEKPGADGKIERTAKVTDLEGADHTLTLEPAEAKAAEVPKEAPAAGEKPKETLRVAVQHAIGDQRSPLFEPIDHEKLDLELDRLQHKIKNGTFTPNDINSSELAKLAINDFGEVRKAFENDPQRALDAVRDALPKHPENAKIYEIRKRIYDLQDQARTARSDDRYDDAKSLGKQVGDLRNELKGILEGETPEAKTEPPKKQEPPPKDQEQIDFENRQNFYADGEAQQAIHRLRNGDETAEKDIRDLAAKHSVDDTTLKGVIDDAKQRAAQNARYGRSDEIPEPTQPKGRTHQGSETTINIPGTTQSYPAQYEVREADDIAPSHNPQTFQKNPEYPYTNERDYSDKSDSQANVLARSNPDHPKDPLNLDYLLTPSATVEAGPSAIDESGNVLGGNSRDMIIKRLYESDPENGHGYKDRLVRDAAMFGLDPEQIKEMKSPVVVRKITDKSLIDTHPKVQKAIADLNIVSTTPKTVNEQTVADARNFDDDAMKFLDDQVANAGGTLRDAMRARPTEIVEGLIDQGVFNKGERNKLLEKNADGDIQITEDGRNRIENLILGRIVNDPNWLNNIPPSVKNKVTAIASTVLRTAANPEWNLIPDLREAIDLLTEFQHNKDFKKLDEFINQKDMLRPEGWSDNAVAIAHALELPVGKAREAFKNYAEQLRQSEHQKGSMFDMGAQSKTQAFAESFPAPEPTTEPTTEAQPKVEEPPAEKPSGLFAEKPRELTDDDRARIRGYKEKGWSDEKIAGTLELSPEQVASVEAKPAVGKFGQISSKFYNAFRVSDQDPGAKSDQIDLVNNLSETLGGLPPLTGDETPGAVANRVKAIADKIAQAAGFARTSHMSPEDWADWLSSPEQSGLLPGTRSTIDLAVGAGMERRRTNILGLIGDSFFRKHLETLDQDYDIDKVTDLEQLKGTGLYDNLMALGKKYDLKEVATNRAYQEARGPFLDAIQAEAGKGAEAPQAVPQEPAAAEQPEVTPEPTPISEARVAEPASTEASKSATPPETPAAPKVEPAPVKPEPEKPAEPSSEEVAPIPPNFQPRLDEAVKNGDIQLIKNKYRSLTETGRALLKQLNDEQTDFEFATARYKIGQKTKAEQKEVPETKPVEPEKPAEPASTEAPKSATPAREPWQQTQMVKREPEATTAERPVAEQVQTFADDSGEYSLERGQKYIDEHQPAPVEIPQRYLAARVGEMSVNRDYAGTTDISKPGMVILSKNRNGDTTYRLIDGWHRAARAVEEGKPFFAHPVPVEVVKEGYKAPESAAERPLPKVERGAPKGEPSAAVSEKPSVAEARVTLDDLPNNVRDSVIENAEQDLEIAAPKSFELRTVDLADLEKAERRPLDLNTVDREMAGKTKTIAHPIVLTSDMSVLDGMHRIADAIENGEKTVQAYVQEEPMTDLPEEPTAPAVKPAAERPLPKKPKPGAESGPLRVNKKIKVMSEGVPGMKPDQTWIVNGVTPTKTHLVEKEGTGSIYLRNVDLEAALKEGGPLASFERGQEPTVEKPEFTPTDRQMIPPTTEAEARRELKRLRETNRDDLALMTTGTKGEVTIANITKLNRELENATPSVRKEAQLDLFGSLVDKPPDGFSFSQDDLFGGTLFDKKPEQTSIFDVPGVKPKPEELSDAERSAGSPTVKFVTDLTNSADKQVSKAANDLLGQSKYAEVSPAIHSAINDAADALDIFARARQTKSSVDDMLRQGWIGEKPVISDRTRTLALAMENGEFPKALKHELATAKDVHDGQPVTTDNGFALNRMNALERETLRAERETQYGKMSDVELLAHISAQADKSRNLLKVNLPGLIYFHKALHRLTGSETEFGGVKAEAENADDFRDLIQRSLGVAKSQNDPYAVAQMSKLLKNFDAARADDGRIAISFHDPEHYPIISEHTPQEEVKHLRDAQLTERYPTLMQSPEVRNASGYTEAGKTLAKKGYKPHEIEAEIHGKLGRDDAAAELGISDDQVDEMRNLQDEHLFKLGVSKDTYRESYANISKNLAERAETYGSKSVSESVQPNIDTNVADAGGDNEPGAGGGGAVQRSESDRPGAENAEGTGTGPNGPAVQRTGLSDTGGGKTRGVTADTEAAAKKIDARKKQLEKQIDKLTKAITSKTPISVTPKETVTSPEIAKMIEVRDKKQAEYDKLFPRDKTLETQLKARETSLNKQIDDLQKEIASNKHVGKGQTTPVTSDKIEELTAQRDALKQKRDAVVLNTGLLADISRGATPKQAAELQQHFAKLDDLAGKRSEITGNHTLEYFQQLRKTKEYINSLNPTGFAARLAATFRNSMLSAPHIPIKVTAETTLNRAIEEAVKFVANRGKGVNSDQAYAYTKEAREIYSKTGFNISAMNSLNEGNMFGDVFTHFEGPGKIRKAQKMLDRAVIHYGHGLIFNAHFAGTFASSVNVESTKAAKAEGLTGAEAKARAHEIAKDAYTFSPDDPVAAGIRQQAQLDAMRVTNTNDTLGSEIGKHVKAGLNKVVPGAHLGDMMVPFSKIPGTLVSNAIEVSGGGLIKGAFQFKKAITEAKLTGEKPNLQPAIRTMIRTAGGMTIAALIGSQISKDNYDEKKKMIRVGGKNGIWISTELLGPIGPAINVIASVKLTPKKEYKVGQGAKAFFEGVKNLPGIREFSDINEGGLSGLARNFISGRVPGLYKDIRSSYVSATAPGTTAEKVGSAALAVAGGTKVQTTVQKKAGAAPVIPVSIEKQLPRWAQHIIVPKKAKK